MEVVHLRVVIPEDEINVLLRRLERVSPDLRDLSVSLDHRGVRVAGIYTRVVEVPFATSWTLSVREGALLVTLEEFGDGLLGRIFKRGLFRFVRQCIKLPAGISLSGETLRIEPEGLFTDFGIHIKANLSAAHTSPGILELEAAA